MQKMMHAFVNGDRGPDGKNHNGNQKTPEIDLLAVTKGKPFIWRLLGPAQPVK
jgi:hypothetical protein